MKRNSTISRLIAIALTLCMVLGMAPAVSALNPAVQSWYTADPAPVVFANDPNTLWVYTSHDEDSAHGQNIGGYNMKDYKCFSTTDMVNWTYRGTPVGHQTFSTWSEPDGSAWAQQVVERNGKYYCYAPIFHDTKAWCIGVAVSDSPTGPFKDAIDKPLYDAGWSGIDPTVFIDDDGQAYMYWGNPTLYCAKLNEDMVTLGRFTRDEVDPAWATVRSDGTLEMKMTVEAFGWGGDKTDDGVVDAAYQEGPWFFKRGDMYYMVYPSIVEGSGESMAYSTSPGPIGPWTYRGVILDTTKQGEPNFNSYTIHGGTIDFKGHSYLFYHNGGLPNGGTYRRSIAVEEFTWGADGSIPYIPRTNEGPAAIEALNPYVLQEAETIAWSDGIRPKERDDGVISVQDISNNDSIRVMNVDFGSEGAVMFTAKTLASAAGGSIEVYLDNKGNASDRIATLNVPNSGGQWAYTTTGMSKAVTGVHDVYYVFKASNANLFEFDNWTFTKKEEGATADSVVGLSVSADTYTIDTAEGINKAIVSVTAIYADGHMADVSDKVTLTGDAFATASGNVVTGKAYGTATVTVSYGGKEAQVRFTVKDLAAILRVTGLKADVNTLDLFVAGTRQLKLTASFADGHTEDVTANAVYTSSNAAAVSCASGLVTAKGEGKATITASYEGKLGGKHTVEIAVNAHYRDPFARLEAETCNDKIQRSGNCLVDTVTTDSADPNGHSLGYIQDGDWIKLSGVKFDRAAVTLTARLASGAREFNVELRKNSRDGELLGRVTGATTGGWDNWADRETTVNVQPGEPFDLYIVFANGDCDINWVQFGDHIHEFEEVVTPPTCLEGGYTASACKYCDVKTILNRTAALGHSWDEGKVTVAPTETTTGIRTYSCIRCDATKTKRIPRVGATVPDDIDFTDPASADQFEIVNKDVSAIRNGQGLYMVTTKNGFEPANNQLEGDAATTPKDLVTIPVEGDWQATLQFVFNQSADNGYYQFFGFYAMEDYQNCAGIRGGDGAIQNFLRTDGTVTADSEELNSAPGLDKDGGTYWFRIVKESDTYTCFRSEDGENFTEIFAYADTGIEADKIAIDAYTGMTEGYSFLLKSLTFEDVGDAPDVPDVPDEPVEEGLFYFVDCGDYNPESVSTGDSFGKYNSVTEQVYGADPVTGKYWGIVDTVSNPLTNGTSSRVPNGVYTDWSWPYEYNNSSNNLSKTATNRYTKNQLENGINRHLQYDFELADGEYDLEIYFVNQWGGSKNPSVRANGVTVLSNAQTDIPLKTKVNVTGGKLELYLSSNDDCLNVSYIMISRGLEDDEPDIPDEPDEPWEPVTPDLPDTHLLNVYDLSAVQVSDPYIVNAQEKEYAYLLSLDADRLLVGFRENAGLSTQGKSRYGGGWEDSRIAGHTMGHYLSALAQSINTTPDGHPQKAALTERLNYCLAELRKCQKAIGNGFLFGATYDRSKGIYGQFDDLESGNAGSMSNTWVPWYTMHKILTGLVDAYNLTGSQEALTIANDLGNWIAKRVNAWSSTVRSRVLSIEFGGMNDVLYELYKITGNPAHLAAAKQFDDDSLYTRLSAGGRNALNGMHANTTIPKFGGTANRYLTTGDETYLTYAENFFNMVLDRHTYITGNNSEWEAFGNDYVLHAERTNCNCETCNAYNMLKLAQKLYCATGDSRYADYYERTFINTILSSQNPETGMTTYFQPMATGYFKVYSTPENSFWCCTGSGMESMSKLGLGLYYSTDDMIVVSQFFSSTLTDTEKNVTLKLDANMPESDTVTATVTGSGVAATKIAFRLPDWLMGDVEVKVNGVAANPQITEDYAILSGLKSGDVITVRLPMGAVAYNLPDGENTYAIKYGPVVLSAKLGTQQMNKGSTGVNVTTAANRILSTEYLPSGSESVTIRGSSVSAFMENINAHLVKTEGKAEWKLTDVDANLTYVPHYSQYTERYGLYFTFEPGNGLEDITVNGVSLPNFSPKKFTYSMKLDAGAAIPVVAATSSADDLRITVNQATELPGAATVVCTNTESGESATYTIIFKVKSFVGELSDIDFSSVADTVKYDIVGQNQSEITSNGLTLITTRNAIEPCKGENEGDQATTPEDLVEIPVAGDWTATLKVDFSEGSASNGYYQFFGFYASEGSEYQNLVGIRGGDGAMQNFLRQNGTVVAEDEEGVNSTPGFASAGTYYLQIDKTGDSYVCSRSSDGINFTEMFSYDATGIEADAIVIDAYTGMTEGYTFTLKSLTFEGAGGHVHNYVPTVTEPTCTEAGFTTYTCECGESYVADEVAALGHNYVNGICKRCGDVEIIEGFFEDVLPGTFCFDAVKWAVDDKITNGVDDGIFAPSHTVTRGQIVTFLWRAAGCPEPTGTANFVDLKEGAFYTKAVAWAVENGITDGVGKNKFAPESICKRGQIVTFLWRYLDKPKAANPATFSDLNEDAFYVDAIAWAVEAGITTGITDELFKPENECTRAQAVTFLYRAVAK